MAIAPYSADNTIAEFFTAHAPITRQQCDDYATSLTGQAVTPVDVQGSFSYTLAAGEDQVIQFRAADSDLDRSILDLAQQIHGPAVPSYSFHGLFCGRIPVYRMAKVPGTPYVYNKPLSLLSDTDQKHSTTLVDLARFVGISTGLGIANASLRFFAASWEGRQHLGADVLNATRHDYQQRFELLSRSLPPRFQENLFRVQQGLPLLFSRSYPLTLNHGDLNGLNVFVDSNTGHITGIIDWPEATISPFGMSLWGVENFLGFMDAKGWHHYPNCHLLRELFWQTFELTIGGLLPEEKEGIQIARMAGLFLQYGFVWEKGEKVLVDQESISFLYLDAFCAGSSDQS